MAPWLNTGERLDSVRPTGDVFPFGKVLWCMISGRATLPFWYHREEKFDLQRMFPEAPAMVRVNHVLDNCIVEHERDCHAESAEVLYGLLYEELRTLSRGGVVLREDEPYPCRICAKGICVPLERPEMPGWSLPFGDGDRELYVKDPHRVFHKYGITLRVYRCNYCHHFDFFSLDEADAPRGWLPARSR